MLLIQVSWIGRSMCFRNFVICSENYTSSLIKYSKLRRVSRYYWRHRLFWRKEGRKEGRKKGRKPMTPLTDMTQLCSCTSLMRQNFVHFQLFMKLVISNLGIKLGQHWAGTNFVCCVRVYVPFIQIGTHSACFLDMFPIDSRGDKSTYVQNCSILHFYLIILCRAVCLFIIWQTCSSLEEYVYFNLTAMAYARTLQFQLLKEQLTVFEETQYEHFDLGIRHITYVLIPCNPYWLFLDNVWGRETVLPLSMQSWNYICQ